MIEITSDRAPHAKAALEFYRCKDTGREYQRILGGFAWPTSTPGFAVILGLSRFPRPGTKQTDIWIVAEATSKTASGLLDEVALMTFKFKCRKWYGNQNTAMGRTYGHLWNRLRKEKVLQIPAPECEQSDAFDLYVHMIRESLDENNKVLFLGSMTKVRDGIVQLPADYSKSSTEDFQPVLALGYALSAMRVYTHRAAKPHPGYVPLDKVVGI